MNDRPPDPESIRDQQRLQMQRDSMGPGGVAGCVSIVVAVAIAIIIWWLN